MNKTDLEKYKAMLEAKQAELAAGLRNREDIAIEKTPDALDEVQLAGERELAIRNLDRESALLRNIKGALARVADGSYGGAVGEVLHHVPGSGGPSRIRRRRRIHRRVARQRGVNAKVPEEMRARVFTRALRVFRHILRGGVREMTRWVSQTTRIGRVFPQVPPFRVAKVVVATPPTLRGEVASCEVRGAASRRPA
jgi:hypothetical protein